MQKYPELKIIILAAGKGTRMKSDEPKALAMLKGKPFLQHILDTLKKLDPEIKPVIVIGHKKERIKEVLGEEHLYAEQHEQLGTGHAVMAAKNTIDSDHETILVISTDQPLVSQETLEHIISRHEKEGATITLTTAIVPDFKEWRTGLSHFGRIVRGKEGLVEKNVEFKDTNDEEKKIKEVNIGMYAFNASWLWENINKIKNENAQAEYYLPDLVKIASDQGKKIEAVEAESILEAFQPNSKEELETLEKLI